MSYNSFSTTMLMPEENIAKFVVDLFQRLHPGKTINANTKFGIELDVDANVRTLYYYAIILELRSKGYIVHMLSREVCAEALTLQDIIDNIIAEKND